MPRTSHARRQVIEAVGWLGAIVILAAYALVSMDLASPEGLAYQLINILGAVAVAGSSYYQRAYQSVVLNVAWAAIGLVALATAM